MNVAREENINAEARRLRSMDESRQAGGLLKFWGDQTKALTGRTNIL
jgi:hypothetical protein